MRTIWKYAFPGIESLPQGAQIVHVDGPSRQFWALVETERQKERWSFDIVGTGHPFGDPDEYVATWLEPPFVWHLVRCRW